jgi:hypothetical protein
LAHFYSAVDNGKQPATQNLVDSEPEVVEAFLDWLDRTV